LAKNSDHMPDTGRPSTRSLYFALTIPRRALCSTTLTYPYTLAQSQVADKIVARLNFVKAGLRESVDFPLAPANFSRRRV
jgi:hypothetical protein